MENGVAAMVLIGLFLFGILYNQLVVWMERQHRDHGYTSILVVGGVAVTLAGMGIIDLWVDVNAFLLGLAAFAASGCAMVIGSIFRHLEQQGRADQAAAKLALEELNDDTAEIERL
jgi:UDP-N-acetylmuramyl pentapeptide phosphotransferase/UDP-N-acetylglucosamine-1-phosphate transferase